VIRVNRMFLARLLAFSLGVVFAWAAAAKIASPAGWRRALGGYALPVWVQRAGVVLVPLVEFALALSFFLGETRIAAALTLALLVTFSLSIARARARQGSRLPCGCFGSDKHRDYRTLLARNTVLATGAGLLLVFGRDVPGYPSTPSSEALLPAALVVVGLGLVAWVVTSVRSGMRRDVV
jgi:hypothetical protein